MVPQDRITPVIAKCLQSVGFAHVDATSPPPELEAFKGMLCELSEISKDVLYSDNSLPGAPIDFSFAVVIIQDLLTDKNIKVLLDVQSLAVKILRRHSKWKGAVRFTVLVLLDRSPQEEVTRVKSLSKNLRNVFQVVRTEFVPVDLVSRKVHASRLSPVFSPVSMALYQMQGGGHSVEPGKNFWISLSTGVLSGILGEPFARYWVGIRRLFRLKLLSDTIRLGQLDVEDFVSFAAGSVAIATVIRFLLGYQDPLELGIPLVADLIYILVILADAIVLAFVFHFILRGIGWVWSAEACIFGSSLCFDYISSVECSSYFGIPADF